MMKLSVRSPAPLINCTDHRLCFASLCLSVSPLCAAKVCTLPLACVCRLLLLQVILQLLQLRLRRGQLLPQPFAGRTSIGCGSFGLSNPQIRYAISM